MPGSPLQITPGSYFCLKTTDHFQPCSPGAKQSHPSATASQMGCSGSAPADLLQNFPLHLELRKYMISASAALCVLPNTAKGNKNLLHRPKVLY